MEILAIVLSSPLLPLVSLTLLFLAQSKESVHPLAGCLCLGAPMLFLEAHYARRHGFAPGKGLPVLIFWLLVLHKAASVPANLDPFESGRLLSGWVLAAGIFTGLSLRIHDEEDWRSVAGVGCLLLAGYCLVDLYLTFQTGEIRPDSTHAKQAFLPLTGLVVILGFSAEGLATWFWGPFALIFLASSALSYSPALVAALFAAALGWSLTSFFLLTGAEHRKLYTVALYASIALATLLVLLPGVFAPLSRLVNRDTLTELNFRKDVVRQTVRHAFDFPIYGSGSGSFSAAYQAYRDPRLDGEVGFDDAGNSFIEMFIESGWPGLVLWTAFLALVFHSLPRVHLQTDPQVKIAVVSACAGSGCLLMLNTVYNNPASLGWMAVLFGLANTTPGPENLEGIAPSKPARPSRALGFAAMAVATLGGMWLLYRPPIYGLASWRLIQCERSKNELDLEQALGLARSATRIAPTWWLTHLKKSEVLMLLAAESGDGQRIQEAVVALKQAEACDSRQLQVRRSLARAYFQAGQRELSVATYRAALRLAPYHVGLLMELLQVSALSGDTWNTLQAALMLCHHSPKYAHVARVPVLATCISDPDALERLLPAMHLTVASFKAVRKECEDLAQRTGTSQAILRLHDAWLKLHPDDLKTRLARIHTLDLSGQHEAAYQDLQAIRKVSPNDLDILARWAPLAVRYGNAEEALKSLAAAIAVHPRTSDLRAAQVACQLELGHIDQARERVDDALRRFGSDSALLILKARVLMTEGSEKQARELLLKAVESDGQNAEASSLLMELREDS